MTSANRAARPKRSALGFFAVVTLVTLTYFITLTVMGVPETASLRAWALLIALLAGTCCIVAAAARKRRS